MSIKRKFASSSGWVAFGNGVDNAVQFLTFAILARLLPVSAIGLVAYAMVFIDVLRVVASAGTAEAVIKRVDWNEVFSATAFWTNLALAILLAGIAVPAVLLIASETYSSSDAWAIACLFPLLIIDAARAVHVAKLRREFNFRSIALRTITSGAISGAAAIAVAFYGGGIWALTLQRVLYGTLTTLQTWQAAKWMPARSFDAGQFVKLVPFTLKVLGSRIVDVATFKLPDFIIGLVLGSTALGYYKVGSRALDALFQLVIKPVQFATLPALSAASQRNTLSQAIVRMTRFFAVVICFAMLASAAMATDVIRILFGSRYVQSATVMQILAFGALPASISFFVGPALIARDKTSSMLVLSGTQLICMAASLSIFSQFGVEAAAWSVVAAQFVWLPMCIYYLSRHFGLSSAKIALAVAKPFLCALLMMAAITVLLRYLDHLNVFLRCILAGASGALLYFALLRILFADTFKSFVTEATELLPARVAR